MNKAASRRRVGLAVCLTLGVAVAGCQKDRPADHLARGKEAMVKQDHAAAIIEFKNVLQLEPKILEARFLLGSELLRQGNARDAEIELQKANEGQYDPDRVVPLLVRSQIAQGQLDKATALIAATKLKAPEANASLQTLLGMIQLGRGKQDEALAAFTAAKKLVPDEPDALLGEARIKALRGDVAGATTQVDAVLVKHPDLTAALVLKGDLARARGDNKAAIEAYLAGIAQGSQEGGARLNLASTYIASNQMDLAQQQVDVLKKEAPRNPGVAYLDGLLAFTRKDFVRANEAIALSIAGAPNNAMSQLLAGATSAALNHPEQAESHLRESLKLNPNNAYARKLLANLYLRGRQPQKAEEILAPALSGGSEDAGVSNLQGQIALAKGDFASASKYFDKAGKIDPKDLNSRTQGAAADFARGDDVSGFAELEAASKISIDNPGPDIALVLARLQRRQYDEASKAWQVLEKRDPKSALTYNLRAAIDLGKGDQAAARKALERALELQPTYFPAAANLAAMDEQKNDLDGARRRFKGVIAKEPGNMSALLALAEFEVRHGGDTNVVVPLLKEARRTNPSAEQPILAMASYYASTDRRKDALATVQEGLAQSPNSASLLRVDGQLLLQAGSVDQAIAAFRKLVAINPESIDGQIALAQAQLAANQPDAAVQSFKNALRNQPTAYRAQAVAINLLLRANQVDAASQILANVRQTSPKSPFLPELDGDVKLGMKKYADAAVVYRKLLTQATQPANLVMKSYAAMSLGGKTAEANALVADWVRTRPKDLSLRVFDAELALRSKDYARATLDYRAALEMRPTDPALMNNLAWVLWQQKDPQALSMAQKANSIAPGDPSIADTYGWMLVEQGETKRGLALLEAASAKAPDKHDIALHLAKAQLKDGKKEAARATLQALVDSSPDSVEGKESEELMATL